MNEEQWLAFMKRADLRSARYAELFETVIDHPERDQIIDHEMGWDRPLASEDEAFDPADFLAEGSSDPEAMAEARQEEEESDRQLEAIVAYRAATDLGDRLLELMVSLSAQHPDDEDIADASIQMCIAGAKIARGHGMGYDADVLCGNIVNNRIALDAANKSLAALESLVRRNLLGGEQGRRLIDENGRVCDLIEARIAELRERVWW